MTEPILAVFLTVGALLVCVVVLAFVLVRHRREVPSDRALIVGHAGREPTVHLRGPVLALGLTQLEWLSLSTITVPISLTGREAVRCRTKIPFDVELTFFVHVNRTAEDVLLVARRVGCERASDPTQVALLFHDRFASAVHEAFADVSFDDVLVRREMIRDRVIMILGADLDGFVLDDVAMPRLAPTPAEMLDPNDLRDAEAIRLITEKTAAASLATNELKREERMQSAREDVDALEARLAKSRRS